MSAACYFRDLSDVRWRLERTRLLLGRHLWQVQSVEGTPGFYERAEGALLHLASGELNRSATVRLTDLPIRALIDAPRGYIAPRDYTPLWVARGPVRDRYQGLRQYSLWYLPLDRPDPSQGLYELNTPMIQQLCLNPRRLIRRNWGWASPEVLLQEGVAYYQGKSVGEYVHRNGEFRVNLSSSLRSNRFLRQHFERLSCNVS